MGRYSRLLFLFLLALLPAAASVAQTAPSTAPRRWSEAKANAWYAEQPWLVGANYIPRDAINQLEMWQAATFDSKEIDQELGWAQAMGMNTMRVFLHDLLWKQDPQGFNRRINVFLTIAASHHIRPIFVLFDSCWDPYPKLGPQHPPIPGVHNSGWVESPGIVALRDPSQYPRLEAYVKGVVGAFANDPRVLAWDVWNEPENVGDREKAKKGQKTKIQIVQLLLPQVYAWARSEHPIQPLTSGLAADRDWNDWSKLTPIEQIQIQESDILSFHNYGWPEDFKKEILQLRAYHRPVLCTEYMARSAGSLIDLDLPIALRYHVGAINWGLVNGKTQTNLPWNSWQRPYVLMKPSVWFHDLLYPDGRPYRQHEVDLIRQLTSQANGQSSESPPRSLPGPNHP